MKDFCMGLIIIINALVLLAFLNRPAKHDFQSWLKDQLGKENS